MSDTTQITPAGNLSSIELHKSLRDGVLFVLTCGVLEMLRVVGGMDFGEYQMLVTAILGIIVPIVNRWLNLLRISK